MAAPILGIDLGTTFSVVAYLDAQGRPVTVPNAEGDLTTPSVVFLDAGGAVVGKEAVKAAEFEPDRIARHPKRDIGQAAFHHPVRGETFPPEVLQALVLRKLKADAEARLGPLTRAVVTVPAYFNEPRRRATQDAGRMAGLDIVDIINEPTAAAICYGVQRGFLNPQSADHPPETILVYDLGGGTFDVTLMRVERNSFTVLATAGDVELGGIDWDNRIIDHVAQQFQQKHGVDPRTDPATAQQLRDDAEAAKRTLSTRPEAAVPVSMDGKRLRVTVTRPQFEEMTADLIDRTAFTLRRLLKDAGVGYAQLTRLLMVGGSSRMPMVAAMLEQETGLTVDRSLSLDEAVAHGAAMYAGLLDGAADGRPAIRVVNVCSHDLGVLGNDRATGRVRKATMIRKNTPLPAEATHKFGTHKDGQPSVVVKVAEGGDASGNGASTVGKCVVRGLPKNLPKNTPIAVTFRYAANGRLEVTAEMPTIGKTAQTAVERASGMADETVAGWTAAVAAGLPDGYARPGAHSGTDLGSPVGETADEVPTQKVPFVPAVTGLNEAGKPLAVVAVVAASAAVPVVAAVPTPTPRPDAEPTPRPKAAKRVQPSPPAPEPTPALATAAAAAEPEPPAPATADVAPAEDLPPWLTGQFTDDAPAGEEAGGDDEPNPFAFG